LEDQIPPGLVEMMQISGLGVAKIRQIHESLHIETLAELEEVARDGSLAKLPRFGKKTAENVLKGIAFLRQVTGLRLFHHAREEAAALVAVLRTLPNVMLAEVAGSVRRHAEIVRDLDFVVAFDGQPSKLFERLGGAPGVKEFVGKGDQVTLRFSSGTVADVFVAAPNQFGFQLIRATGNPAHLDALAARAEAKGLSWSDAGLAKGGTLLPSATEEHVYQALGLAWVPPELREGLGEVDAAQAGTLPTLLKPGDLKGFLHCHSTYSDGTSSIREWADAAKAAGYAYLGLTDHSKSAAYAGGLSPEDIGRQHAEIDDVNRAVSGVRILKGVEADILADGSLDYTPEIRAQFEFIIASIHQRLGMQGEEMTQRILKAMDDPATAIIGHPTGRLLLSRDPYPMDIDQILKRAGERGVAIEINADPQRLDLDWRLVRQAVQDGVIISIGADAHSTAAMGNAEIGVGVARKGWLTKEHVLNARPLDGFLAHVAARRGKKRK
jgi:DNA polymerase (family 10)